MATAPSGLNISSTRISPQDGVCFPNSLAELSFGDLFDQSLDTVELPRLQHLSLGQGWNHGLEELELPELQSLVLGDGFNQSLEWVKFPESLRKLLGLKSFECSDARVCWGPPGG